MELNGRTTDIYKCVEGVATEDVMLGVKITPELIEKVERFSALAKENGIEIAFRYPAYAVVEDEYSDEREDSEESLSISYVRVSGQPKEFRIEGFRDTDNDSFYYLSQYLNLP